MRRKGDHVTRRPTRPKSWRLQLGGVRRLVGALLLGVCFMPHHAAFASEGVRRALAVSAPAATVDALISKGQALKSNGQLSAAIRLFRDALQLDPDALVARRELSHALILSGAFSAARFQLDILLRSDPSGEMRTAYRRVIRQIDRDQPVGVTGEFAVLPSSNVNSGTTNTDFEGGTIDPNSQQKSGVGVLIGISGYLREDVGPNARVRLTWGLSKIAYADAIFNSMGTRFALSYEHQHAQGRWAVGAHYAHTLREDDASYRARGVRIALDQGVSDTLKLGMSALTEQRVYPSQSYNTGHFSQFDLQMSYTATPSLMMSVGIGAQVSSPLADNFRYTGYTVTTTVAKEWRGGLQTRASLQGGTRIYDAAFAVGSPARRDHFGKLSVGVQHSDIDVMGFTPRLSCSQTLNRSNIAFYDYARTECQASISKNF